VYEREIKREREREIFWVTWYCDKELGRVRVWVGGGEEYGKCKGQNFENSFSVEAQPSIRQNSIFRKKKKICSRR
jgi:hypothetical protein